MPTKTRTGFPEFFSGRNADDIRSQFIQKPLAAAQDAAFTTAVDTLQFLAALPDAILAARTKELRRLAAGGGEDDPRLRAAEAAIDQATQIKAAANLGHSRARRILTALTADKASFHGFVSDEQLAPLPGMTVRITGGSDTDRQLSATTDDDGYFSIALEGRKKGSPAGVKEVNTGERGATDAKAGASVEILDRKGKVVHRDPTELVLTPGRSAYREYFIDAKGSPDKPPR